MLPHDAPSDESAPPDFEELDTRLQQLALLERTLAEQAQRRAPEKPSLRPAISAIKGDFFDPETGLLNRAYFERRLAILLEKPEAPSKPAAVMVISASASDRRTQAHEFNGLMRLMGKRLRQTVRGSDLVARVSDDSFAVGLTQMSLREDAAIVARILKQALESPFEIKGQTLNLTPAIGIALRADDQDTPADMLARATNAMRDAQENNDGQFVFFHADITGQLGAQLSAQAQLQSSVEQHRFINHYQPRFDLTTGLCIGAEALVRWLHPQRGIMYPSEFLDLAKATDLIVPIGAQVLQQACMDAMRWGHQSMVAVNISAREFHSPTLIQSIKTALANSALPAQRLQLEITEDSLRLNKDAPDRHNVLLDIAERLSTLRAIGVRIALDDFGAGVASLSTLHNYDIDTIKVDTQFVEQLPGNEKAAALLAGIVDIARRLKVEVVAEGVERPEQIEILRTLGCHQAQGYALGHPQSSVNLSSLVREHSKSSS